MGAGIRSAIHVAIWTLDVEMAKNVWTVVLAVLNPWTLSKVHLYSTFQSKSYKVLSWKRKREREIDETEKTTHKKAKGTKKVFFNCMFKVEFQHPNNV